MGRLGRRLGKLEGVSRTLVEHPSSWDLTRLTRDELVGLEALARKAEDAAQAGEPVVWTAEEEAALARLDAKVHWDGEVAATETT